MMSALFAEGFLIFGNRNSASMSQFLTDPTCPYAFQTHFIIWALPITKLRCIILRNFSTAEKKISPNTCRVAKKVIFVGGCEPCFLKK